LLAGAGDLTEDRPFVVVWLLIKLQKGEPDV